MSKKYTGSLNLEWYNKNKSIINLDEKSIKSDSDIPAPQINWINKDEALFYEISEEEGKGLKPFWVDRNDIRVKEARPLVFQKCYQAREKKEKNPDSKYEIKEHKEGDSIDVDNILIKGDNLLVLNALKKHFDKLPDEEKVKCIVIDPPYNTGSAFEQYDDNLAHSEWLTLVRDRLAIMKELLHEEGSIWITIDDDESHYLKILCDETFGRENFVANVIWQKKFSPQNDAKWFSDMHDHIIVYAKQKDIWRPNLLPRTSEMDDRYKNIDDDPRGSWTSSDMTVRSYTKEYDFPIKTPGGRIVEPTKGRCWFTNKQQIEKLILDNRIWFGKKGNNVPRLKSFLSEVKDGVTPLTLWLNKDVGNNQEAKKEVKQLNDSDVFDTPKPERLLERILHIATIENDLVLDCFGGSGTTFAVAHKMRRKWIGVEIGDHMESHIIPRIINVITGKDHIGITKKVDWRGGGSFKYYHLGESIISIDKETGKGEFNWLLGKEYLQDSLLHSYDYIKESYDKSNAALFKDEEQEFSYGKLKGISGKSIYGIVDLVSPGEENSIISNKSIKELYSEIRKQKDFQGLVVYTNKGIDIAQDAVPKDMEIIKVPQAIFSELER